MEDAWKSLLLSGDGKHLHSSGVKGKAIFLALVLLPRSICHLLHHSWLPLSLRWHHLPETRNLKLGCLQAGLPSPFRSTPFIQQKNGPFILQIHTRVWDSHKTWPSHLREALQSEFPLSGLPLKNSQVNHKGGGAAFSVPPLFSGNSRCHPWKEEEE